MEKTVTAVEDIFELMSEAEVALALNHRFSFILSKEIAVQELVAGEYVEVSQQIKELLSTHWARFVLGVYLNFSAVGRCPYYFQQTKFAGKKVVIPVALLPGEYTYKLSMSDKMVTQHQFAAKGNVQPAKIFSVASANHPGVSVLCAGVKSEMGILLAPYKEMKAMEALELQARTLALTPPVLLQRTVIDPSRSIQQNEAKIDALLLSSIDDSGYPVEAKPAVRRDDDGYVWLPDGYVPSSHQPSLDVQQFSTERLRQAFRSNVERTLSIPSDQTRTSSLSTRSQAAVDEAHTNLIASLRSICADLGQAVCSVYNQIHEGAESRVTINHSTRVATEMLNALHQIGVLDKEGLVEHIERDYGIQLKKRVRLEEETED